MWLCSARHLETHQWVAAFTSYPQRYKILVFGFVNTHCPWALGIRYLVSRCIFHALSPYTHGSWCIGRDQALGSRRIIGCQDSSGLVVIARIQVFLAWCVSFEFFAVLLVIIDGDIYPSACPQLAERVANQSKVTVLPYWYSAALPAYCDCTFIFFPSFVLPFGSIKSLLLRFQVASNHLRLILLT